MDYQTIVTNVKNGVIQTPAYIFDIDILREKVAGICEILGGTAQMCYAIKANPFLLNAMDDMVDKYEVCSPGELEICRNCRIPMEKIVFSGINKTEESIRTAARYGVGVMTVESLRQFDLIAQCAESTRRTIPVILRLTNGSQFGINEQDIEQLVARKEQYPYVHMLGIQYFTGTQKKKVGHIIKELDYADTFCTRLREAYRFDMEQFEYGTGLWVPYFTGDSFDNTFRDLTQIRDYFADKNYPCQIILEMGRYPVASCGYFATRAEDCKTNQDTNYCVIDGGIHHINYYGQNMALKTPVIDHCLMHERRGEPPKKWVLCGSLCTFNDVVARNLPLRDLRIGDFLIFHNCGAYSVTEGGYLFLSRDLPNIYFADDQNGIRMVRKGIPSHVLNTPDYSGRRLDTPAPRRSEMPVSDSVFDEPAPSRAPVSDSVFDDLPEREAPLAEPVYNEPPREVRDSVFPDSSAIVKRELEKGAQAPRLTVPEPSIDDGPRVIPLARQTDAPPVTSRRASSASGTKAHTPKRFVPETDVPDSARSASRPPRRNSPDSGQERSAASGRQTDSRRRDPDSPAPRRRYADDDADRGGAPKRRSAASSERSASSRPPRREDGTGRAAGTSRRPSSRKKRGGSLRPALLGLAVSAVVIGGAAAFYYNGRVLKELDVEAGTTVLAAELLCYDSDKEKNQTPLNIDTSVPGEYPVEIRLAPFTYKATIHVKDTKAPEVTVKSVTISYGAECRPEDFIESISDASSTTVAFASQPDLTLTGDQEVRLTVTDAAGNIATATATLSIGEALPFDEEAPTVLADDIHLTVGGTIAYKKAIRAYDNVDHADQLTVEVDNSQVDLNTVGDYPYTVTVTDRNGNTGTATGTVHVLESGADVADIDEVNAMADEILAQIITDDMQPKDKLKAIYDWIRSNTRYAGHAQEEDYTLGAYEGFTKHSGDCFTYAAQAKFLLTRAGIDNIDVVKVVPEGATDIPTHFWNLVNIGEGWYHYDCTPRKDGSKFFYLTDAELAEYSDANNGTHKFDPSLYPEIQ